MGPHFVCRVNVCLKKRFTKFLNIRVCVLQANEGDIDSDDHLHCDFIITRSLWSTGKKNALYTRDRCASLTRPLCQVFTYVYKCPTHRHLVWDISQCIQFNGYNTQTIYKSLYQQVYDGKIIEFHYCNLFHSDVKWFVLVTKMLLCVRFISVVK